MKDNGIKAMIVLSLLLFWGLNSPAQTLKTPNEPKALKNSFWSLAIQDADTGEELVGIRSHNLMTPASTMKVVSTATLWSEVGGGKRINTDILYKGDIKEGVLRGDLVVVGHGDPSIGSRYFWHSDQDHFFKEVVNALKQKGIKVITGSIIAQISERDFQANNPRWTSYDMGNGYAPGHWSLNAYDNSFELRFDHFGESFTTIPELPEAKFSRVYSISAERKRDSIYISNALLPDGSYPITGVYPGNVQRLRVRGAIPNPPLFVAFRLKQQLTMSGIKVQGGAKAQTIATGCNTLLYTYQSPTLRELIKLTLVYSHNLFAEGLLKQLAENKKPLPGHNTTQTAIQEVYKYWSSRGIDTREIEMMDGSGLSIEDRVTAHFMATLLGKVHRADPSGSYRQLLPRAGIDGTLTIFLKGTPLEGKAYLKSGTLRNVVCYAGYVVLGNKTYTISFMVNNYYGKASVVRKAMEEVLLEAFGLR